MTSSDGLKKQLISNPSRAETILACGLDALNKGDLARSSVLARRTLRISAQNYFALFYLLLSLTGRDDKAERKILAKKIVALDPSSGSSFYSIVSCFMSLASVGVLDNRGYEEFYLWTARSISTQGLRDYSALTMNAWFRDKTSSNTLSDIYNLLGNTLNGRLISTESLDPNVSYLITDDITRYIGEMAALFDFMNKLIHLGHLPRRDIHVLIGQTEISNTAVLDLWSATVKPIRADDVASRDPKSFLRLNVTFLPYGKRFYMKAIVYSLVQREWERKKYAGLLNNTERASNRSKYIQLLSERGWNETDKIVCFHLRETTHDQQTANRPTQTFRNSNPEKFRSAIAHLVDTGHKVIRIGAQNTYSYGAMDGFFDYANNATKLPEMDVEILRNCTFYFGSESGPLSIAIAFDKPCCTIDHGQISGGAMPGRCVLSTKLFLDQSTNRLMSLRELLHPPLRYVSDQKVFEDHRILPIENTGSEVLMVLREFLRRLSRNDFFDRSTFGSEQKRAIKIFKQNKIVTNGLLCQEFLERYDYFVS